MQHLGGWIIGDRGNVCYAIANVKKGNQQMLWFNIISETDAQGKPSYQVIDVLNLPKLKKNEQLSSFCMLKRVSNPEIIAIVKSEDTQYYKQIRQAWRANINTGKIEVIPTRNIICENQDWGV